MLEKNKEYIIEEHKVLLLSSTSAFLREVMAAEQEAAIPVAKATEQEAVTDRYPGNVEQCTSVLEVYRVLGMLRIS